MGKRDVGEPGSGVVRANPNWVPPVVATDLIAEAIAVHLPALQADLAPATQAEIATEIVTLLGHFYIPERLQALEDRLAANWAYDLAEYPLWAIQAATESWRRTQERRPTIAAIRKDCEFWVSDARAELELLRKLIAAQSKPDVPATTH